MNSNIQPDKTNIPVKADSSMDSTGVLFMTVIKITDPETGDVLLQQRGDE